MSPAVALLSLEKVARRFGDGQAKTKLALLKRLARTRLRTPGDVLRLHETLLFLRAYPDDARVLKQVEAMLRAFHRRGDLRAHAAELTDSGIAGTAIVYPFFIEMAEWLVRYWPDRVDIEWNQIEEPEKIENILPLITLYAESPGLDEWSLPAPDWLEMMKSPKETAGAFLIRRFLALHADPETRRSVFESLGLTFRLSPGAGTPSRTMARAPRARVHYQRRDLSGGRPDLLTEIRKPPFSVRPVSRREGETWIDLAREAMVTRSRDLDAFSSGDPDDVRIIDCGNSLQFAAIGLKPEKRLLLEAVYGFLTIKNGAPIGYVLNSALYNSAEIAYNVFDAYRGVEAAAIYGRVLAAVHHLFGADTFTIYPYQLGGDGNDEGLASGAWWFYQKLGFRARNRAVLGLMNRELRRMEKNPAHRSSLAVLRRLSGENVYWHSERKRNDVIGILPLSKAGWAVTRLLARRFGSDREEASRVLTREAATRLGVRFPGALTAGERLAFQRWAPLVASIPGIERWSPVERRDLFRIIRAKGGRRESDFVRLFDGHSKVRRAIAELALRKP